jgi:hypothetical protein
VLTAVALTACASSAIIGFSTEHRFEHAHTHYAPNPAATAPATPATGSTGVFTVALPH